MNRVIISMKNGDRHTVIGFESEITQKVSEARAEGGLLRLERDRIPTGQMIGLDPNEVSSVKGE